MSDLLDAINAIEHTLEQLQTITLELIRAARIQASQLEASSTGGDDWRRFPAVGKSCPITGLSRSSLYRLKEQGSVRTKHLGGAAYYSAGDALRLLLAA